MLEDDSSAETTPETYTRQSPMPFDDSYVDFLRENVLSSSVYISPYRGNSGDHLIRLGTQEVLHRLDIRTSLNPFEADLLLWPGGNPTMWETNVAGWKDLLKRIPGKPFLVGPATFQKSQYDWSSVIAENKNRFLGIFARDPVSFSNLQSLHTATGIRIGLSHDPALYLRQSNWLAEYKTGSSEEYLLASFRNDHESELRRTELPLLPGFLKRRIARKQRALFLKNRIAKVRATVQRKLPMLTADVASWDFESFVDSVRRAAEVHTDRLHCMILSALLGKRVVAYPTSYRKLETVYDYSLKQHFPNIQLAFPSDETSNHEVCA